MSTFAGVTAGADDMLVSTDDYFEWTGQASPSGEDEARAETAIQIATGIIRAATRRHLTRVTDDFVILDGDGTNRFLLPEYPVVGVTTLTDDGATMTTTDYEWSERGFVDRLSGVWTRKFQAIHVTYTHGYATLPADISGVCLGLSHRLFDNPGGQTLRQETIGSYSVTYDTTAPGLTSWEAEILSSYVDPSS